MCSVIFVMECIIIENGNQRRACQWTCSAPNSLTAEEVLRRVGSIDGVRSTSIRKDGHSWLVVADVGEIEAGIDAEWIDKFRRVLFYWP